MPKGRAAGRNLVAFGELCSWTLELEQDQDIQRGAYLYSRKYIASKVGSKIHFYCFCFHHFISHFPLHCPDIILRASPLPHPQPAMSVPTSAYLSPVWRDGIFGTCPYS